MPSRRIESFDSLLRDLVSYGLVERDQADADSSWELTQAARSRLDELEAHRGGPVVPEKLVYLDHACAECRKRGLTRLRDGVYLCQTCAEAREARGDTPDDVATADSI